MAGMSRAAVLILGLVCTLLAPAWADAACSISSTGVNFGTYDVFSATPLDSTGTITFSCNNDERIRIRLGTGGSGSYFPRKMSKSGETLDYNLYRDAARTLVWGNNSGGTVEYSRSVNEDEVYTVTVYGRIPAGQDVSAGTYADTVTMTILW